jgi:hypothetical protein
MRTCDILVSLVITNFHITLYIQFHICQSFLRLHASTLNMLIRLFSPMKVTRKMMIYQVDKIGKSNWCWTQTILYLDLVGNQVIMQVYFVHWNHFFNIMLRDVLLHTRTILRVFFFFILFYWAWDCQSIV